MKCKAERLVYFLAALATIEEVLLDIITDGEQRAASRVGCSVHPAGASDAASQSTYPTVSSCAGPSERCEHTLDNPDGEGE